MGKLCMCSYICNANGIIDCAKKGMNVLVENM